MPDMIRGLVTATHTPFHDDHELNLDAIESQAEHLLNVGVNQVFICGTTGECMSLTLSERMAVADRWLSLTKRHEFRIIVHVGANCLKDAVQLAKHAQRVGADAIAAVAPSYFKPSTTTALVECVAAITTAAPEMPFYYYDIPSLTGIQVSAAELLKVAIDDARLKNLVGIKYTNPDLIGLQACLGLALDRFNILYGVDELYLAASLLGVHGAVGSGYNFAAPLYHNIARSIQNGEQSRALKLQNQGVELVKVLCKFGYLPASKALMSHFGVEVGPTRPPLKALDSDQREQLRNESASLLTFD